RLWGVPSRTRWVKDGIGEAVVGGDPGAVNPGGVGTKAAAHYTFTLQPGETAVVRLRLSQGQGQPAPFAGFDDLVALRRAEADEFYEAGLDPDTALVRRQAYAGLLWSKQSYHYDVAAWLDGDPAGPPPPAER